MSSVAVNTLNQLSVDFKNFYSGFAPTPSQEGVLRDAGIEELGPQLYSLMRGVFDFPFHAQYFFKDPNDPRKPLRLEPWQVDEIYYSQYGEAYLQTKANGFGHGNDILTNVMPYFMPDGTVKRKKIAINSPRGFGKSVFSAVVADEFALHYPNTQIALFSTSQEQANSLMSKVRYFIKNSIFAMMIDSHNNSKTQLGLSNGSIIKAFPQSEVSTRGEHPHIKVIDEKARIQKEFLEAAIRPMGRKTCWLEIGISTPFGRGNNHYRDCMDTKNFHTHLLKPTEVSWVDEEKLKSDAATISQRTARQELYAEFLSDSGAVFSPTLIQQMFNYKLKNQSTGNRHKIYVMGSDYGKHRDYTVFYIAHMESNGVIITDRIERYRHMTYDFAIKRQADLCEMFNVKLIVPDGNGVGIVLVEELQKALFARGLRVMIYQSKVKKHKGSKKKKIIETGRGDEEIRYGFIFNNYSKLNLVEHMQLSLMSRKFQVPYHGDVEDEDHPMYSYKVLEDEMIEFVFEKTKAGNLVFSHPTEEDAHDDVIISAMLANWGFRFLTNYRKKRAGKSQPNMLDKGGRMVRLFGRPTES